MEKESVELMLQHLDKLGEKLGVGVEKIWPWFIRQVYIDSIQAIVFMLISSGLFISCAFFAAKHWKIRGENNEYSIYHSKHEPLWFAIITLTGLFAFFGVCAFWISGFDFLNPELHAFKSIIASIK